MFRSLTSLLTRIDALAGRHLGAGILCYVLDLVIVALEVMMRLLNHGMGSLEKAAFCEWVFTTTWDAPTRPKRHQFKLKTPPNFSIQVRTRES
jgi:hypothetical protein